MKSFLLCHARLHWSGSSSLVWKSREVPFEEKIYLKIPSQKSLKIFSLGCTVCYALETSLVDLIDVAEEILEGTGALLLSLLWQMWWYMWWSEEAECGKYQTCCLQGRTHKHKTLWSQILTYPHCQFIGRRAAIVLNNLVKMLLKPKAVLLAHIWSSHSCFPFL